MGDGAMDGRWRDGWVMARWISDGAMDW